MTIPLWQAVIIAGTFFVLGCMIMHWIMTTESDIDYDEEND
jgi:hypothetical protein